MNPKNILIDNYDYPLPDERIASHPLVQRDECLLLEWSGGRISDHIFKEVPDLLPQNSTLVYNNTRVINARLRFAKSSGAKIEIFCLEPFAPCDYAENFACRDSCVWTCLVGNSKRWKTGVLELPLSMPDGRVVALCAERLEAGDNGSKVKFSWDGNYSFAEIIGAAGEIPIPPYLNRSTEPEDSKDYQTVYSAIDGSVAAPTAGLHFTDELLKRVDDKGIERLEVTLHVGAGTFKPVSSDSIGEHDMHSEFIAVPKATVSKVAEVIRRGNTIIAVGTTSVRTLESLYHIGCLLHSGKYEGEVPQWYPYEENHSALNVIEALECVVKYLDDTGKDTLFSSTRIIIAPGYTYRVVGGMITNFHQPRSTLLLLVSAFIGDDKWREIYDHALSGKYRFLSYGDACLLLR